MPYMEDMARQSHLSRLQDVAYGPAREFMSREELEALDRKNWSALLHDIRSVIE